MSKKTLKNAKAKIKSAHKKLIFIVLLLVVAGLVIWFDGNEKKTVDMPLPQARTCLKVDGKCFELEVADDDEERMKGLSGRASLPADQGMLFIFGQPEEQCFWMKDMKFGIDMVWTDRQKKILKIQENVSPETYPDSFCENDTQYVLEFNQGFAARYGLKVGTTLQF